MGSRDTFLTLLLLQIIFVLVVVFDIPVFRQAFCFFYLTFIPGFLILSIIGLNLKKIEAVVFSVGFSIAFLMIVGLLVNEFGLILGFQEPLSAGPLLICFNAILFLFSLIISRSEQNPRRWAQTVIGVLSSIIKNPLTLAFILLPFLTIFGSYWNNVHVSNIFLLIVIGAIAALFAVAYASKKLMPSNLYIVVVLSIAISLLLHRSLVSNYVQAQASDIYNELAVFNITKEDALWRHSVGPLSSSLLLSRYNDMLSITVLPTVLSSLTNFDPQWVLKLLFPLFFSFVPLVLYCLWRRQFGVTIAFGAVFLFMAEQTFFMEMLGLARQMVGELFLGLIFLVLLSQDMGSSKKIFCFALFGVALVASHYALCMLFLFFGASSLILAIRKKQWQFNVPRISWILLFIVIMLMWYVFTAESMTFESILDNFNQVLAQAGDFLDPAARGGTVLRGLGIEASPSIWNTISRVVAYSVQLLIGIGFLGLVLHKVETKITFNQSYFRFLIPSMGFLAALIIIPGLAGTLNMTRFYHLLLFFLAPMVVIGAQLITKLLNTKLLSKIKVSVSATVLLSILLVAYFLFQTNFVYEVAKSDSWSLPLSGYRMSSMRLYGSYIYLEGEDLSCANWVLRNTVPSNVTKLYIDMQVYIGAVFYSGLWKHNLELISNRTGFETPGVIFLNTLNVNYGLIVSEYFQWNTSEFGFEDRFNLIYSNGASEIYAVP